MFGRGWIAHIEYTAGQRRWAEKPVVTINLFWFRFMKMPVEMDVGVCRMQQQLPDGAVWLKYMPKMVSDYCSWEKDVLELRPHRCPPAAHDAALQMLDVLRATDGQNRVFYTNGPHDTGKSSSAMLLALTWDAFYVSSYDFSHPGHKLRMLLDNAGVPHVRLVIEVAEADAKLLKLLRPRKGGRSFKEQDMYDKGSTNNLFDNINLRTRNVALVMTGNTPFKHLEELIRQLVGDVSITKPSRVHVLNVGGDTDYSRDSRILVSPFPCPPETKGPSTPEVISSKSSMTSGSDSE